MADLCLAKFKDTQILPQAARLPPHLWLSSTDISSWLYVPYLDNDVHISEDRKMYFFIWMQILEIGTYDCFLKSLLWRILFKFFFFFQVLVLLFKEHHRWQVIPWNPFWPLE